MKAVVNIRMDDRLKKAIEKFAEQQGISFSALVRQTIIEKLQSHGIDWREEHHSTPNLRDLMGPEDIEL